MEHDLILLSTSIVVLLLIEAGKRHMRAKTRGSVRLRILSSAQKAPIQWKKFLANSENKTDLLHFLAVEWSSKDYVTQALSDRSNCFYLTDSPDCFRLQRGSESQLIKECASKLSCNHEEADTCLILHASHASMTGHNAVGICSPDTDVAVIATAHSFGIQATIVFLTDTKNRCRFINLTQVGRSLGRELCLALPGCVHRL